MEQNEQHQQPQEAKPKKEAGPKLSKAERLAGKIQKALAGKTHNTVTMAKVVLSGPSAEAWLAIRAEGERLGLDETGLMAALVDAGGKTLLDALKKVKV